MAELLIKNVRIIGDGKIEESLKDILIDGGIIKRIDPCIEEEAERVIDGKGLYASAGLVDMHVHLRDPGQTYKEDIITGCRAAAAGGVTTVAAMPNTSPSVDSCETVKYILEKAEKADARVLPVAAITKGLSGKELTDMEALKEAGAAAFSDDGVPVATGKLMYDALINAYGLRVPVLAHCEDMSLAAGGKINDGASSILLDVKGIPGAAEDAGTAREIALAFSSDTAVHICHVSTEKSVELIRSAKKMGAKVTCETCPHYFTLTDEILMNMDADYRMNPPLRTQADVNAIIEGICDGTIDAIATDHAPHTPEEKSDFVSAPNGSIGLETSLAAGITYLVKPGYITLPRLIELMSENPARILKIRAGVLSEGKPADVTIFSDDEKWIVDPEKLHGKSKNTPFKNTELCGRVKYTVCRGKVVYEDK